MSQPIPVPPPAVDLVRLSELRRRAADRVPDAASHDEAVAASQALTVLHGLASSPATAAQALALLHELQVHQVELDLQAQELREARNELEETLRRQGERYDRLPVGCLRLDERLLVLELNETAARMLGLDRTQAVGLPLGGFVAGDSLQRLRAAIARLGVGPRRTACPLMLAPRHAPQRPV
ncbi:PAS domain-containing protein, partial [Rubrivivax gelatinosus]